MKYKGALISALIITLFGSLAWIQEGFNVFTGAMYSLALFLIIWRHYAK